MMKHLAATCAVVLFLLASTWAGGSGSLAAQNPPPQGAPPSGEQQQDMQQMMKMHEQMMAEMKAADARLDALVKAMDASSGDAKVTAMAAVVTELVRQNKAMHERMGQMHQQMMGGRGMMMKK